MESSSADEVPWYQMLLVAKPSWLSSWSASCKWFGGLLIDNLSIKLHCTYYLKARWVSLSRFKPYFKQKWRPEGRHFQTI